MPIDRCAASRPAWVRSGRGGGRPSRDGRAPWTVRCSHAHEAPYTDPWLIRTDLPPDAVDAAWYGMRAWIEQGFKLTKRAGFQWQRTRITDPARAERLWLAVAVATLWLVQVGGAAKPAAPESTLTDLHPAFHSARRQRQATRAHLVGVFRRGWRLVMVALLTQQPLPQGYLVPHRWPLDPPRARSTRQAA